MTIPRAMRINLRGMPTALRAVYVGVIAFAVILMLVTLLAGLPMAVPPLLLFLGLFLFSAPVILERRWRPVPKPPTRRPVVRRRRA